MSGTIKLRISPAVAAFAAPGVAVSEKLRGVSTCDTLSPHDQVTLLFCLMRDREPRVSEAATAAFRAVPEDRLLAVLGRPELHPSLLDAIARFHHRSSAVSAALLCSPSLSTAAARFLRGMEGGRGEVALDGEGDEGAESVAADVCEAEASDEAPEPAGDEYLSKFQMIQQMGISEKIKMALTGDKEWRAVLVNDNNKLVSCSVIKNPRITEAEILKILKVGAQNDEIVRLICANKEWVKNYQIRKALVDCPKTPLPLALRFLASLGEKDVAGYAKSKNVSTVISSQAKRMVLARKQ